MLHRYIKIILSALILFTLVALDIVAQVYSQSQLPDGARARLGKGQSEAVFRVAFSPDSRTLASAGFIEREAGRLITKGTIRLWDVGTGALLKTLEGNTDVVLSVAFSPDGRTLASGGFFGMEDARMLEGSIRLWDVSTGRLLKTLEGHEWGVNSVAFSPNGQTLASGSLDETIRMWDTLTGRHKLTIEGHTEAVLRVAFSPDGQTLASGSEDNTIRFWVVTTGEQLRSLKAPLVAVNSVAFSPNGRTLASGGVTESSYVKTTMRLWDVGTGKLLKLLEGHPFLQSLRRNVNSVAFSTDGSIIVGASEAYTIGFWDVKTGTHLNTLEGHTGAVNSVAFSPDGRTLASGSDDGTILLWNLMP